MNIRDDARYQIRLGTQCVLQLPTHLLREVIVGAVSPGAFVTYALMFSISDDDLCRPPSEIAEARGLTLPVFHKHLDQLEAAGWLDRDQLVLDQADNPVKRVLVLHFEKREVGA